MSTAGAIRWKLWNRMPLMSQCTSPPVVQNLLAEAPMVTCSIQLSVTNYRETSETGVSAAIGRIGKRRSAGTTKSIGADPKC